MDRSPGASGRLFGAVLNYGLGSYLPQVVNFFLVPLYTHYISPAEMGALEIYLTAQVLVVIGMRLGLNGAVTRYYFEYREDQAFRDLVATVSITVLIVSGAVLAAALAAGPSLFARFLPEVAFHPYMEIALVGAFFQAAPDIQRRLQEAREQSRLYARLTVSFGLLTAGLTVVLVVGFGMGLLGILLANLGAAVLYAGVALVLNGKDLRGRFRMRHLREALAYGLPLVPHHAASWAQQFVGRWVLAGVATTALVGHFGLAAKVASPLAILSAAFARAYSPVYFSWRSEGGVDGALQEARRVGRVLVVLGTVAVIGAATLGSTLIRHAMDAAYAGAAPLVGLLAAAHLLHLLYVQVATELFFTKRTQWISTVFIVAGLVNLGLVVLLGPRLGALGAAVAQLAGGLASLLIVLLQATRTIPSPLSARCLIVATLGGALACALVPWLAAEEAWRDGLRSLGAFAGLSMAVVALSGVYDELRDDVGRVLGWSAAPPLVAAGAPAPSPSAGVGAPQSLEAGPLGPP